MAEKKKKLPPWLDKGKEKDGKESEKKGKKKNPFEKKKK